MYRQAARGAKPACLHKGRALPPATHDTRTPVQLPAPATASRRTACTHNHPPCAPARRAQLDRATWDKEESCALAACAKAVRVPPPRATACACAAAALAPALHCNTALGRCPASGSLPFIHARTPAERCRCCYIIAASCCRSRLPVCSGLPEPRRAQLGALSLVRLTPVARLARGRTILGHLGCVSGGSGVRSRG